MEASKPKVSSDNQRSIIKNNFRILGLANYDSIVLDYGVTNLKVEK